MLRRTVDRDSPNCSFTRHDALDAEGAHLERLVGDNGIDLRGRDDVRQMCGIEIGGAEHKSPRNPVDLDQRKSCRELIRGCDEYRSTAKLAEAFTESGAGRKLREGDRRITGPQRPVALEPGAA